MNLANRERTNSSSLPDIVGDLRQIDHQPLELLPVSDGVRNVRRTFSSSSSVSSMDLRCSSFRSTSSVGSDPGGFHRGRVFAASDPSSPGVFTSLPMPSPLSSSSACSVESCPRCW